jgi:Acetylornithine deacetylase/Succinyl-diaminopimelate desuccinylase and related deacylases
MKFFTEEQSLDVLKNLVAIKSDNDNELKVASYLKDLLAKYDIESEIKIIRGNRANLVAEIGHGKPVLGISGHMDVVAAGNLDDWDSDPYQLTEKDGQLYGRGATDMKSGLAALVITMIELHHQGLPKQGTIRLMATMGEEVGEEGSSYFLEDGSMDDVDGLVIGEPSGYNIGYAEKGSMDIKFISKGKASHSSMPEKVLTPSIR